MRINCELISKDIHTGDLSEDIIMLVVGNNCNIQISSENGWSDGCSLELGITFESSMKLHEYYKNEIYYI